MSKEFYLRKGDTSTWITPLEVTQALGKFDIDPCAAEEQPWKHAKKQFTEEDNGLAQEWVGRVWMNPPYASGEILPFIEKFVKHGDGIALVFPRTETRWFQLLSSNADLIFFKAGRIQFCRTNGLPGGTFLGSVFVAIGEDNSEALLKTSWEGVYFGKPRAVK